MDRIYPTLFVVINTDGTELVATFNNEQDANLFADGANEASGHCDTYVVALVPDLYKHRD